MNRWDIINRFIKERSYKDYLEIGYYKGWSFDAVDCKHKTAVDPNPSKTIEQEKYNGELMVLEDTEDISHALFKMTSDKFFEKIVPSTKWDIIFIDGLHEASQVFRDVVNAIKHLNDNGVIIMHDCNPPLEQHTTTGIDGCWTGDTYKAAIYVKDFGPFYTVDTDWGVGVLHPTNKQILQGTIFELVPNGMWWENFDRNRNQLLNLITKEEFLNKQL